MSSHLWTINKIFRPSRILILAVFAGLVLGFGPIKIEEARAGVI